MNKTMIRWKTNTKISKKYSTTLLIRARESKNILLDVVSKTSNSDITIQSINSLSQSKDEYVFEITVMVDCKESLVKFMNDINSLQKINSIERIIK